jgi:hypothetical protein
MLALAFLLFTPASTPPTKTIAWKSQPDQFPLGTVVQGSRVEMSLGVFSGLRPSPMPSFITKLPSPLRKPCEWGVETFRNFKAKSQWRLKVEAPDFLKVDEAGIQFHSSQGPFAFVAMSLKADRPGRCDGNLVLRLSSAAYAATNIIVPVKATVEATHALSPRKVLITQTPYECYSTGNGRDFEPLADLITRLTAKGLRLDLCRHLPSLLSEYSAILVGGDTIARLNPAQGSALRKFVSGGGRLVVAADAFFVPTTPRANEVLSAYGLEIIDRDAAKGVTNSAVIADPFTAGVKRLDFWRPAPIKVTDQTQAKLLVVNDDGPGGFVAVSRSPNRGEVIVVTQSLWWNWIRSNPTNVDNSLLLENLLSR